MLHALRCRGRGAQVGGTHSRYPKPTVASHTCLANKHTNQCIDADLAPNGRGVCATYMVCQGCQPYIARGAIGSKAIHREEETCRGMFLLVWTPFDATLMFPIWHAQHVRPIMHSLAAHVRAAAGWCSKSVPISMRPSRRSKRDVQLSMDEYGFVHSTFCIPDMLQQRFVPHDCHQGYQPCTPLLL